MKQLRIDSSQIHSNQPLWHWKTYFYFHVHLEDKYMKSQKVLIASAISGALALGSMALTTAVSADDMERCYGVAKAGHNDCQTANSSCAGTSTMDSQGDAFVAVPKGLCAKLTGGTLEPMS